MSIFSRLASRLRRKVDRLTIENFPLHTERPDWAAHAPAQVEAACKRGAIFIGFTETRGPIMDQCKAVAKRHGYHWHQAAMDKHRNVSILVKDGYKVLHVKDVVVNNNHRLAVTIDFHGRPTTYYQMHWERHDNQNHLEQTHSLIAAMHQTSKGAGVSFYGGDENPSKPQRMDGSEPNATLSANGMPVVWEELGEKFPPNIGVNGIGRNLADTSVKAVNATPHAALGSDHIPVLAVYAIKRRRFRR